MSLFHAPLFLDVDDAAHEADTRGGGYGPRYGRLARARRDTDLPRFGLRDAVPANPQRLPAVCFSDGRAC